MIILYDNNNDITYIYIKKHSVSTKNITFLPFTHVTTLNEYDLDITKGRKYKHETKQTLTRH